MHTRHTFLATALALSVGAAAQNLTDAQITLIKARLAESANQSWELGTRAQALLELESPSLSVLSPVRLPPPTTLNSTTLANFTNVVSIAEAVVAARPTGTAPQPFIVNGAAGDPASLGVAVLMANWTGQGNASVNYADAATQELQYLLTKVPQTPDGAISHRQEQVQLWSDFVYMVPPFLAYSGVVSQNRTLLTSAYTQISLYRSHLRDLNASVNPYNTTPPSTSLSSSPPQANPGVGLWSHIILGNSTDLGHWSTGNGWAAAGMLRVLGTIKNSQYANVMKGQIKDLGKWVDEIHDAIYPHLQPSGLFFNYADNNSSFQDAASTALLAATVYRQALLTGTHRHLPAAEKSRKALFSPSINNTSPAPSTTSTKPKSTTTSSAPASTSVDSTALINMAHFTADGYLTPVVNPHQFGIELVPNDAASGSENLPGSPEAQAFVLELQAAWRDWVAKGSPGANGAMSLRGGAGTVLVGWAVVGALVAFL